MSTRLLFIALYIVSIVSGETYTDWAAALTALEDAKDLWIATGITDYVYRWQPSCFCMECYTTPKYIVIENGVPIYVEFDESSLDATSSCVTKDHIQSPLSTNFHDISYYYDRAIAHATAGLNAGCSATTVADPSDPNFSNVCGGSILFTYDPTYYYPTALSLNYGPFIADAGISWTFSCLTPATAASSGTCDGFTMPSAGDSCGTAGVDCDALRCACASCEDGSGNSYGCCGCKLVENADGELMCSGLTPQDDVCPATTTTTASNSNFCGGFAGVQCEDGFYCVDDPSDTCDPANGGADCGGICVAVGDSCEDSPDCPQLKCACAICPDNRGTYGCCGCTWQLDERGLDVICSGITSRDDVCPLTTTAPDTTATAESTTTTAESTTAAPDTTDTTEAASRTTVEDTKTTTEAATTTSSSSDFCGGFAGIQCEDGSYCVDDPSDDCDPANGGADCGGICVAVGDSCADSPDCPEIQPLCPCALCPDDSGNTYGCCGCKWQLNDRETGVECVDVTSRDDVCPATTTTESATTTGGGICAQQDVNDLRPSFDNSESTTNGFGWCKFCVCRSLGHPQCERLVNLYLEASEETIQIFNTLCDAADYVDLQDANGEQCDFSNVRVKDENDIENCWCDALYCNDNPFYDPRSGSRSIGNQVTMLCIGFMVSFFWWM